MQNRLRHIFIPDDLPLKTIERQEKMEPEIGLAPMTGLSFQLADTVGLHASFGGYCDFTRSAPRNGLHRHTYHEICLVLRGRGEYRHGKDLLTLRQGDVFLSEPDVYHEIRLSPDESDGQLQLLYFLVLSGPYREAIPAVPPPYGGTTADWVARVVMAFFHSHVILARRRLELLPYGSFLSRMDGAEEPAAPFMPRLGRPATLRILETFLIECLEALSSVKPDGLAPGTAGFDQERIGRGNPLTGNMSPRAETFTWTEKKSGGRAESVLSPEKTMDQSDPLAEAMRLIRRNPGADLSLTVLAQMTRTSNRTLQRLFRDRQGTTFQAFRLDCRMRQAAAMLRMNFRVSDAAEKSGMPDPARFSRMFRKYHGMSPKQYQRSHMNQTRTEQAGTDPAEQT